MISDECCESVIEDEVVDNITTLEQMLGLCDNDTAETKNDEFLQQIQTELERISAQNSLYTEKLLREKLASAKQESEMKDQHLSKLTANEQLNAQKLKETEEEYHQKLNKLQNDNESNLNVFNLQKSQLMLENEKLQKRLLLAEKADKVNHGFVQSLQNDSTMLQQQLKEKSDQISTLAAQLEKERDAKRLQTETFLYPLSRQELKLRLFNAQTYAKDAILELRHAKQEMETYNSTKSQDKQKKRRLMRNIIITGDIVQNAVNECKELMAILNKS